MQLQVRCSQCRGWICRQWSCSLCSVPFSVCTVPMPHWASPCYHAPSVWEYRGTPQISWRAYARIWHIRVDSCATSCFPHWDLFVLLGLQLVLEHHQCSAGWFLALPPLLQAHIPSRDVLSSVTNVSHVGFFMFSIWGGVSAREQFIWDLSGAIATRACPESGAPVAS